MSTTTAEQDQVVTFTIQKQIEINAPIEVAWEAALEQLGPGGEMEDGRPFPFVLEAWPGGRWFRDLGNNAGHFWGSVQVIKPPKLLELSGPFMMSFAATNHLQYRLEAQGKGTLLKLTHQAMGRIPPDLRDGMNKGWGFWIERARTLAERRASK
jgi:uncharacterized protein YndB with AHSA1/START domain